MSAANDEAALEIPDGFKPLAIGAAMLGLAETFGLAYAPTYSVVFTFVILVIVLAFRPRGLMGRPA